MLRWIRRVIVGGWLYSLAVGIPYALDQVSKLLHSTEPVAQRNAALRNLAAEYVAMWLALPLFLLGLSYGVVPRRGALWRGGPLFRVAWRSRASARTRKGATAASPSTLSVLNLSTRQEGEDRPALTYAPQPRLGERWGWRAVPAALVVMGAMLAAPRPGESVFGHTFTKRDGIAVVGLVAAGLAALSLRRNTPKP